MIDLIWKLVSWILGLWNDLPKPVKDKVIELASECFDQIFRAYYRNSKNA
jgi:hypothetical protein